MFTNKFLIPMNLQMFSEEPPVEDNAETTPPAGTDTPPEPEKKYTDKDVDEIIAKRLKRWEKEQQDRQAEAERLAKMSAEERANEEIKSLKAQLDEYKKAEARHTMADQVVKELAKSGLSASADIVNMLVRDTAEDTSAAIKAYVENIQAMQKDWAKERNSRTVKTIPITGDNTPTKQDILKMTYADHVAFKMANPELYEQIMK